jgi:hypothetical protein
MISNLKFNFHTNDMFMKTIFFQEENLLSSRQEANE